MKACSKVNFRKINKLCEKRNVITEYFIYLLMYVCIYLFIGVRETEHKWGGGVEGEGESQAGSTPSMGLDVGFSLMTLRS